MTAQLRSGLVALVGWTNVGKSTLLNRLVGVKLAAVADVAQTTRRRILGACSRPGGQIIFVDTPGVHEPRYRMNRLMLAATREAVRGVDLTALVVDAARGFGRGDGRAAELIGRPSAGRLAILNKIDLVHPKSRLLQLMQKLADEWDFSEIIPVSARTGDGCDVLVDAILSRLPHGPPLYPDDFLTDQPQRVIAAEWIREKLLHETRQELPHATAVTIDAWAMRPSGVLAIEAGILVERESQKKIVIGAGGEMLRRVGTAARTEIESLVGCRVLLRLWVRVREHWRDDERILRGLELQ